MKLCIVSVKRQMENQISRVFSPITCLLLALVLFWIAPTVELCAQDVTPRQKQAIKKLVSSVDRAAKQFKAKKLDASAKYIDQANKQLAEMGASATPAMIEMIKPDYDRLSKAHQLLSDAGQKLAPLVQLPTPAAGGGGAGGGGALKPDAILVQNPPSLPGLACVYLACVLRRCQMVLDWHNLGFTMFDRGPRHPLVWFTRQAEAFFGRRASINLTVSHAMRNWVSVCSLDTETALPLPRAGEAAGKTSLCMT